MEDMVVKVRRAWHRRANVDINEDVAVLIGQAMGKTFAVEIPKTRRVRAEQQG